jgi:hypothetical protein
VKGASPSESVGGLSARLDALVESVGVERMTATGVQRRVRQRARRRRFRRGLGSAASVTVALFVVAGVWNAVNSDGPSRVVTRGPLVPTSPQGSSLVSAPSDPGSSDPTSVADPAVTSMPPPTSSATASPALPTTSTTTVPPVPRTTAPMPADGRSGPTDDVPTTRGGPADPATRGN